MQVFLVAPGSSALSASNWDLASTFILVPGAGVGLLAGLVVALGNRLWRRAPLTGPLWSLPNLIAFLVVWPLLAGALVWSFAAWLSS